MAYKKVKLPTADTQSEKLKQVATELKKMNLKKYMKKHLKKKSEEKKDE